MNGINFQPDEINSQAIENLVDKLSRFQEEVNSLSKQCQSLANELAETQNEREIYRKALLRFMPTLGPLSPEEIQEMETSSLGIEDILQGLAKD
jgi:uncharacterized tellurite resistance protein B-like protein